jgi:NAD(P)-dependent dehydrogenase (short-subunit alcohol dehydrogenase family)
MLEATHDLEGRTFLVTGVNSGIGFFAAAALAARGGKIFLGCRSVEKAEATAAALRAQAGAGGAALALEPFAVDLGDLSSVRSAAAAFVARGVPLHGLVNNAGVAGVRGLTRDGFELTFGVNHLGPFLLTRLLEPALRAAAPARVVNVASNAHRGASGIDFAALRRPTRSLVGWPEYGVSKLCNILFTRELARRWAGTGVTSYALHPGVVATGLWRRIPQPLRWLMTRAMISSKEGSQTTIFCATAPELAAASGRYYRDEHEARPTAVAEDDALAARLWEESERMTGLLAGGPEGP